MLSIENGIIYKTIEKGSGNTKRTIITALGNEYKWKRLEVADRFVYQWYKFNLELEEYEVDITNTTPIIVKGVEYTPVNGAIEVAKTS